MNNSIDDQRLHESRMDLYHSSGSGFVVFRNYISDDYVKHIVDYWTKYVIPEKSHEKFVSKEFLYNGCPNYFVSSSNGSKVFYNAFWNPPCDAVTYEAAFRIAQLRNQIEAKISSADLFPFPSGRCLIPRVVITKNGENILVPHSDFGLDEPNPANIDLRKTQATLYLSEYGRDYTGTGFIYTNNQGEKVFLGKDLDIRPGDLVIWKQSNVHEIESVYTEDDQMGFVRILFPCEDMKMNPHLSNEGKAGKASQGNYIHRAKALVKKIIR